ncbi:DUF3987 domain-containing protein [Oscillospiraceae bacterium OttesenSCG-928-F05]|nr:DUF3987 domain-containing protein [Oscillospiraceae bacterium OttesenSCG-928-F05]
MRDNTNNNIAHNVRNYDNIPAELKAYPNFVLYRLENRGGDKPAKIPYSVHGGPAKVNDPATWATFDEAVQAYQTGGYDGLGYVLEGTPYIGIDIDNCYDDFGNPSDIANQICGMARSYTEISQSGKGLHNIMRGTLPGGKRRNTQTGVEMYGDGSPRYFALTGNVGGSAPLPINDNQAAIDAIHATYIDINPDPDPDPTAAALAVPPGTAGDAEQHIALGLMHNDNFRRLYNGERPHGNESSDDMALFNFLAYYSKGNAEIMKRDFFNSQHYQTKDDAHKAKCQRDDYMTNTIKAALAASKMTARMKDAQWQKEHSEEINAIMSDIFLSYIPFDSPDESNLPDFPLDALPDLLKRYTEAVSESLQVAPDMVAVILLNVICLCIQKRFTVNPKADWRLPVNLYTLVIARPSEKKSPVLTKAMRYVYQYVSEENERRQPEVDDYNMKCNLLKKKIEALTKKAANGKPASNSGLPPEVELKAIMHKLSDLEKHPVRPLTLTVNDVTLEALSASMADNGEKMGIVSAEGGMFQILSGLYSGGNANIDVVLNSFDGEPVQNSRKSSKDIDMQNPVLTIMLMAQPIVLADVMDNRQFLGRGFLARFLYSMPQSVVGTRKYNTVPVSPALDAEYKEFIYRLLEHASSGDTDAITYTPEAEAEAERLHDELEPTLRDGDSPALEEWGGKLGGKVAKIAAILHIAKHVEQAADIPISGETFANARKIGDYFAAHAKEAYQKMGAAEDDATADAKYILKRLMECDEDEISKRDLYQLCSRSRFPKTSSLQPGLDVLVDRGYIAVRKRFSTNNHQYHQKAGGRPTEIIYINPLVFGDTEAIAEDYDDAPEPVQGGQSNV